MDLKPHVSATDPAELPVCRWCQQPVSGECAFDPAPLDPVVQSVMHPRCAAACQRGLEIEAEKRERQLRRAAKDLLAACKAVLAGFRYEKGRPVMPEWQMKELLATAIAKAEPQTDGA